MGLRINTNVTSLAAQRTLSSNNQKQAATVGRLSSGSRLVRASDDAAGMAISEKLRAQIRGMNQAGRNANDGISLIQTAEGGLNEVSNILIRLRELAIQSASDTVGDAERKFTNVEYQNLKQEIDRIAQVAEFNGKKLLNGEGDKYDFQIGINNNDFEDRIKFDAASTNATTAALKVGEIAVDTKEGSQESLSILDDAIQSVSGHRADLGAIQNRLTTTISNLQITGENLNAANSQIRDTDYATETANNIKLNIMTSAGTSVLSQANAQGQAALKLIG
ncbi:MAG: flagellin FliC [Bacteriovoracaceae bacterium]|nr:flagellin FliC [Bacteriovoracaceae bacterium]